MKPHILIPSSILLERTRESNNSLAAGETDLFSWVIRYEDYYYMTYTTNDNITILRSPILTYVHCLFPVLPPEASLLTSSPRDWNNADVKLAFSPPENTSYSYDLWAPELHFLNGLWYIIFTADVDADMPSPEQDMLCDFNCPAVNHRMFVLESSSADPWTSEYTFKAQLDTFDQFAIDGTYFVHPSTGALYHVYSCWEAQYTSWPSMLCISPLADPWTLASPPRRSVISVPDQPWEKTPYNRSINVRLSSNEGPQQLTNPATNQTHLIYSAARSDNRNYCLGRLTFVGAGDPLDPASWQKYTPSCVFAENPAEEVYGVGHASFTTSPDGSEHWIVYHGMHDYLQGWSDRTIRAQKFTFDGADGDGLPVFPTPGMGPFPVPSGQGLETESQDGSAGGGGGGESTISSAQTTGTADISSTGTSSSAGLEGASGSWAIYSSPAWQTTWA